MGTGLRTGRFFACLLGSAGAGCNPFPELHPDDDRGGAPDAGDLGSTDPSDTSEEGGGSDGEDVPADEEQASSTFLAWMVGEAEVEIGGAYSGTEALELYDEETVELLCRWESVVTSTSAVESCESCDFAFRVEIAPTGELEGDRCDVVEQHELGPEERASHLVFGYEDGGTNGWSDEGYGDGAIWWMDGQDWVRERDAVPYWQPAGRARGAFSYMWLGATGSYSLTPGSGSI